MAFIREYALADEYGDPFLRGFGRRLKRIGRGAFRAGRGAFKLARRGVSLAGRIPIPLPGPIGLAQRAAAMLEAGDEYNELDGFSRTYGDEWGDPGRRTPKRKQAGAGPKTKAARKREVRKERRRGPGRVERGLRRTGEFLGGIGSQLLPGALGAAAQLLPGGSREAAQDDLERLAAGLPPMGPGPAGGGPPMRGARVHQARYTKDGRLTYRKRPSMQATNTRALRRSLRRIEGFQQVVKRVYKAMPALRPGGRTGGMGKRGHKAGCRCVACK